MSIPAALFKRRPGREPGASARCSIRRACGGSSLMARSSGRSGAGRRFLLRRRPLEARREDRLSALSDDLLLLVLRRLDTRTALGTGLLSRRWAHLPRELHALDLRVGDMLPPRYHRWVHLHCDIDSKGTVLLYRHRAIAMELVPNARRYERRAMRAFTSSVESFLEGPRRRVDRLSLEFFITGNAAAGCMNRLIAEAVDAWGVDDLSAVAKPTFRKRGDVHTFLSHGLCKEPRASRLRRLELGGCVLPPLHEYIALTILVLRGLPESTPAAAYEGVFTSCPQLQTLHLISCGGGITLPVVVDAPSSAIRELVVDHCEFQCLWLRALPRLESLASLGSLVLFESTSFPCLRQRNIAWCLGVKLEDMRQHVVQHLKLELDMFLRCTPNITNLIIRFTGPDRWIVPSSSLSSFLPNLRRLLVADVPSSWDVSWPRLLFEIAPSLETLHIHISPCEDQPGEEISWQPTKLRLHHLKEFVVAGFEGTARQIYLVKFVVGVCTALNHVAMFKNGHARDKGHWDWEMVTQQNSWTDEEKDNTLKQIMDGVSSSTAPIQLVLG